MNVFAEYSENKVSLEIRKVWLFFPRFAGWNLFVKRMRFCEYKIASWIWENVFFKNSSPTILYLLSRSRIMPEYRFYGKIFYHFCDHHTFCKLNRSVLMIFEERVMIFTHIEIHTQNTLRSGRLLYRYVTIKGINRSISPF